MRPARTSRHSLGPLRDEQVRYQRERQQPRVVLRVEQQPVQHAGGDRPRPSPPLDRPPVRVARQKPHRRHRHVEAIEMRVVEDPRHHREQQRPDQPRKPADGLLPPEIGRRHCQRADHHAWEAHRSALLGKPVPVPVEVLVREREQRLHQRRVLVVRRPVAVHGDLLERLLRMGHEQVEPGAVALRRREVEALVPRVAEVLHRRQQQPHVARGEQKGDQRVDQRTQEASCPTHRESA